MKRIYTLIALPRSGSTPISKLIGHYLHEAHGYYELGEYLNVNFRGIQFSNNEITCDHLNWAPYSYYKTISRKELENEKRLRFKALEESKGRYFFKTFIPLLSEQQTEQLFSEAQVIFLQRKNLYENLLSHMISLTVEKFYEPEGIKLERASINADLLLFQRFLSMFVSLQEAINSHPCPRVVYYEDFLSLNHQAFIRKLGFKKNISWNRLHLTKKQNIKSKESLFSNLVELQSWYKKSTLNSYFKI